MYRKSQEPPLRQQERLWNISEDIHQFNKNIVSSSEQLRKRTKVRWLLFLYPFLHTIQKEGDAA